MEVVGEEGEGIRGQCRRGRVLVIAQSCLLSVFFQFSPINTCKSSRFYLTNLLYLI